MEVTRLDLGIFEKILARNRGEARRAFAEGVKERKRGREQDAESCLIFIF